jgi:2-oxoglutarate ferredoxin oxidoreductase subunit alpha
VRAAKIQGIANDIPEQAIEVGTDRGKLLVLGWGSTYGAIREAVARSRARGLDVSHAHVRYLNPFPKNLGELLKRFDRVLVPELNLGQLVKLVRSQYLVPAESLPKVQGKPFRIEELEDKIRRMLES